MSTDKRLVLYSDGPYEEIAHDTGGHKWDRFFGSGFYRFKCQRCGEARENGWIRYGTEREEICTECTMVVYDVALSGER